MITEEERQSIINEAIEKALLALPEVVGNLIMNQVNLVKMNKIFYDKFPEFSTKKDIVQAVVEKVEEDYPGTDYEEILKQAVPLIRERIKVTNSLTFKDVKKPNRNLASLSDLGEL